MGALLSCPNCFTRELQTNPNEQVQGLSDTCLSFHTNFERSEMKDEGEGVSEKVRTEEGLSKVEVIDGLQRVLKEFLKEVGQAPEDSGYVRALSSAGIEIFLKDVVGGYSMMSVWKCDVPARKIAKFLGMAERRKEWDSHVAEFKRICEIGEGICLYYTLYKRFLTMAPRDVLVATQEIQVGNAWVNISTSIGSNIVPENERVVRAKVNKSGYFIQDMEKDEWGNCSRVISVFDANYGQSVASAIVKKMTVNVAPKYVKMMIEAMKRLETELN